jgi:hypothetical protein
LLGHGVNNAKEQSTKTVYCTGNSSLFSGEERQKEISATQQKNNTVDQHVMKVVVGEEEQ